MPQSVYIYDSHDHVLTQDGTFSVDKAIAWLNKNAYSNWNAVPTQCDSKNREFFWYRCATWIIRAINAGFDDGKDHTVSTRSVDAKNDGPALESIGYQAVTGDVTTFEKGDIIIFQPSSASASGHIEMWTGTQFISDWKQGLNFYPNVNRTCEYPSFTVYRYYGN